MIRFALRSLVSRPLRSFLALIGLSISLVGVIGLISVSLGLRRSVRAALEQVHGIVVIKKNSLDPIFSRLPVDHAAPISRVSGVRHVVPELWEVAPSVEGQGTLTQGLFGAVAVFGIDPVRDAERAAGGLYFRHLREGRFLGPADAGRAVTVVSRTIAARFGKRVGDPLRIADHTFEIVGLYETGALFLDVAMIIPIDMLRARQMVRDDAVSNFYVDVEPNADLAKICSGIEAALPDVEANTGPQWEAKFGGILEELEIYLRLVSSIAILVGTIGIVNTMLMSVTERVAEFGVLRANGWTRADVLRLVLCESVILGAVSGVVGCGVGTLGVHVVARFAALAPVTTPSFVAATFVLALLLGVVGGLYPALRAARMNPIEAIRFG